MKKLAAVWVTGLLMLAMTGVASASVITITDRSVFNAQGVIAYNSNFQDYGTMPQDSPGKGFPGTPFFRGDVIYNSAKNQIVEPAPGFQNLMTDYDGTPLLAYIKPHTTYNMLGFDISQYGNTPVTITVFTNKNSYIYPGLTLPRMEDGLLGFTGYIASSGEFFTGFRLDADKGLYDHAAGITNVAVGNSPAPEPATLVLMCIGGLLVAFRLKRSGVRSGFTV